MATTTRHETTIELDERVPLVRITREFDAPVSKVYRAHTDPDLIAQWLGPARARDDHRPVGLPHRRLLPLRPA